MNRSFFLSLLALVPGVSNAWEVVQTGTTATLRTLQFIGTDTGYVFGDAGVYLKTTNGGTSWTKPPFPATTNLGPAYFVTGQRGWVVAGGKTIYRTTDGGQNWDSLPNAPDSIRSLTFVDANRGWVVRDPADTLRILATLDGGVTWSPVFKKASPYTYTTETHQLLYSVRPLFNSDDTGLVLAAYYARGPTQLNSASSHGVMLKTVNGGQSWNEESPTTAWKGGHKGSGTTWQITGYPILTTGPCPWDDPYLCGRNPSRPLITVSSNAIRRISDGDSAWRQATRSAEDNQFLESIHSIGKDTAIAVGTAGLVFRTNNGGTTWVRQALSTSWNLYDVKILSPTRGFVVGENGTLFRIDPTAPFTVAIKPGKKPRGGFGKLSHNVFRYTLPYAVEVSATMMDLRGKIIWVHRSIEAPGNRTLVLPLDALPPGHYALEFRAGGLRESFRVLKEP